MLCFICDVNLSDKEVIYNPAIEGYEPCTTCLDAAFDAAFTKGFMTDEDDGVPVLDEDWDDSEEFFDMQRASDEY